MVEVDYTPIPKIVWARMESATSNPFDGFDIELDPDVEEKLLKMGGLL